MFTQTQYLEDIKLHIDNDTKILDTQDIKQAQNKATESAWNSTREINGNALGLRRKYFPTLRLARLILD